MLRDDLHKFPDYKPGKSAPNKLKLSANEIPNPPLPSVLGAMTRAASCANRYQVNGSPELRAELSSYLELPEENIAVAPGASAIVQQAVMATCHTVTRLFSRGDPLKLIHSTSVWPVPNQL